MFKDLVEYLNERPQDPKFLGWIDSPDKVEEVVATLPMPFVTANAPLSDEEVLTYKIYEQIAGRDEYPGPQTIGDCVGHGWKRGVDYTAIIQIFLALKAQFGDMADLSDPDIAPTKAAMLEEFQEASSEAIYGMSRVDIGGQRNSYSDGSVGAWAAKAVATLGTVSWSAMKALGLSGTYSGQRAKDWGAKGVPTEVKALAKNHTVKNVSKVTTWDTAKAILQSGYVIPVCSNRGFTMTRDSQGFCKASGTWNHCMMISSYRKDREGGLIHQNWGPTSPGGPIYKGQPGNTFWADAEVIDAMLRQGDSFAPSAFEGYPAQNVLTWQH